MPDFSSINGIVTAISAIIGAIISSFTTIMVVKRQKKENESTTSDYKIRPTGSFRTSLDHNINVGDGAVIYKCRKFDKVRSTISGVLKEEGSVIVVENSLSRIEYTGIQCFVSSGVFVNANEEIGVVSNINNGEGIITFRHINHDSNT